MDVNGGAPQVPQAINLQNTIKFSGAKKIADTKDGSMTAENFITEMENRKLQAGWTDAQAINYVRTAMVGDAATWFRYGQYQDFGENPEAKRLAREDWAAFKTHFNREYGLVGPAAVVSWADEMKQRKGESVSTYLMRVGAMWTKFFHRMESRLASSADRVNTDPTFSMVTGMVGPPGEFFTDNQRAYIRRFIYGGVQDGVAIAGQVATHNRRAAKEIADELTQFTTREVNPSFFTHSENTLASNETWDNEAFATFASWKAHVIMRDTHRQQAAVHEVEAQEEQEVDAVGGKKGKSRNTGASRPDTRTCRYCNKKGHIENKCKKKKKDIKEGKLKDGKVAETSSEVSTVTTPAPENYLW